MLENRSILIKSFWQFHEAVSRHTTAEQRFSYLYGMDGRWRMQQRQRRQD